MSGSSHPQAPPAPDPSLPAVNRADGVARLMGDRALFARVLARFCKEYRHAGSRIREALAAGDLALAQRLAHTLKGAAGMIEAVPLREEAQILEQDLRRGAGDPTAQLARLERALDRVLRELDELDGAVCAAPAAPAAQASLPAHIDGSDTVTARLRALLEDGNGDAVDLAQTAAANLTRELGEECYRGIAAAIEVFDFEGALALLNRCG